MNMLNSVILEGRVVEIRNFNSKIEVVLESDRNMKNSEGVVEVVSERFITEASGNFIQFINEYVQAGKMIRIVGRLAERKMEGQEYSKIVVFIEHLEKKN